VLQADGFVAGEAVEMHMIVVMMPMVAGGANSIFGLKLLIRNPVQYPGIHKLLQAAVNGGPVNFTGKCYLQICMRQCTGFAQKSLQDFNPLVGLPELVLLKNRGRLIFH
jgi:hypothetical protein